MLSPKYIPLVLKTKKPDGKWQVRDIITDEVSLAKTYRYEFNKIAKGEGIDGIISKLEDKLQKLDAGT